MLQWPPHLTDAQLATLAHHATTYALAHGLDYLPPSPAQPPFPSSAIHAPISLLPSPVPRALFYKAQRLQSLYNSLYARIATDDDWLDQVVGAVGQADAFVRRLWQGWKQIREQGIVQVRVHPPVLAISCSNFHSPSTSVCFAPIISFTPAMATRSVSNKSNSTPSLPRLVHFRIESLRCTGRCSMGMTVGRRALTVCRYLYALTDCYHVSPHIKSDNFPPNETTSGLAAGLAEAHNAYGVSG